LDAWTIFGAIKLFLEIIEDGPSAIVKGVLVSGLPFGTALDVGEVLFGFFDLNGNFCGEKIMNESQYIPLASLTLLNKEDFELSFKEYDFPTIAKLEFAKMRKRSFPEF